MKKTLSDKERMELMDDCFKAGYETCEKDFKKKVEELKKEINIIQNEIYGNCELTEEANLFCSLIRKKVEKIFSSLFIKVKGGKKKNGQRSYTRKEGRNPSGFRARDNPFTFKR